MYTGNVSVGGPAQVRELPMLIISKMAVGPHNNNTYLLRCRSTGAQLLIDAAADGPRIIDLIGPSGLSGIITTHRHADHWQALTEVHDATGAPLYAHSEDAPAIEAPTDHLLADGSRISFGDCQVQAIHIVGHTPGSVALLYEDPEGPPHLFTGDTLFPGGVGKTWSTSDFDRLYADVTEKVFATLPDETWVYPGHGGDTTLGNERPFLAEWKSRGW
ncbi:MAG: MBL fold metallo-hydrolase [Candidatus Nanopelagicales bacterium]|jgi:glyoxylase-like metal-dependent hydrolase (beta-lactamase superfamily II)|nr:MBL fold metallo-hydrolase [Candidatus Nanopelagicales bacterium]